ncbi:hypothetical protein KDL01_08975 [Actinospica durhamensis]|uniref:Uncharacterized protein n=1 Tax=Actinospica durhamensis TaxID=1508375 RepID=A0A941ISN1_9ACTN|nr:hypothetical protein [Actinospica durhamensis]MBR7833396.1 hypothetical protein [Actinospica durhamensis]
MTRTATSTGLGRGTPPGATDGHASLTPRRRLQLVLAGLWVLDGLLKLQPFMFTKDFAPMTFSDATDGAPGWLARPIHSVSNLVGQHPVGLMVLFALIELAIGFGIAWPRTVRLGLIGCIVWVPFLWFFAEGLGGLASGSPSAFGGAPGASILYGLLAVLLWPNDRDGAADTPRSDTPGSGETVEATRFVGIRAARAVWLVLWGLFAVLAFLPHNLASDAFSDTIAGNVEGAPVWYVSLLDHATAWSSTKGAELGIVFGLALALVALSVLAPWRRVVRAGIVLALGLSVLIWVFGEGLGMPFMGMGTDPDTAPLLAVIALVYWPRTRRAATSAATSTPPAAIPDGAAA